MKVTLSYQPRSGPNEQVPQTKPLHVTAVQVFAVERQAKQDGSTERSRTKAGAGAMNSPRLAGAPFQVGNVEFAPAMITFIALPRAGNRACQKACSE
jgi:hypothetical protein